MSDGLILRIRTEALWTSLDKLKNILAKAPNRRVDLNTLKGWFDTIRTHLKAATESLTKVQIGVRFGIDPSTADHAADADKNLTDILKALEAGIRDIGSMHEKYFRIQETELGTAVETTLKSRAEKPMSALEELQGRLADPATDLKAEWPVFRQRLQCVSETIFAEYIEFLGGLALRDTGFDLQISQLAEEVIRTYSVGSKAPGMLAIPARQQAIAMTLPRIIRVTYPDWSIWSLPSTAFEFWRVIAQNDLRIALRTSLRQRTRPADEVEPRFQECLGDAFATYTLGPAYAFYCVCLQLDPAAAYTSGRTFPVASAVWDCGDKPPAAPAATATPDQYPGDGVRVNCILRMLELMEEKQSEFAPAYSNVRAILSNAWDAAVQQSAAAPGEQERAAFDKDKDRGDVLVEALWNTAAIKSSAPFTTQGWNEVQKWVAPLLAGKPDTIRLLPGAELRHVLNAAWLARVDAAWQQGMTESVDRLAQRVRTGGKN